MCKLQSQHGLKSFLPYALFNYQWASRCNCFIVLWFQLYGCINPAFSFHTNKPVDWLINWFPSTASPLCSHTHYYRKVAFRAPKLVATTSHVIRMWLKPYRACPPLEPGGIWAADEATRKILLNISSGNVQDSIPARESSAYDKRDIYQMWAEIITAWVWNEEKSCGVRPFRCLLLCQRCMQRDHAQFVVDVILGRPLVELWRGRHGRVNLMLIRFCRACYSTARWHVYRASAVTVRYMVSH